jgi:uroporphyrinogen-III synthase
VAEPRELEGRVIAVAESRELDVFAALLERRGATPLRCPMVEIHDAPDPAPVLAWIERFNAGGCDDLILLTGEGLRRLLGCLDRHRPAARDAFVERLSRVRKIARGPKPGRALRALGLKSDLVAEQPTTAGVIASLRTLALAGRRVGVQLYGSEPNQPLIDFLEAAGAKVATVAPYVYADAAEESAVASLIDEIVARRVDAIAFTSLQQVERLARVAKSRGATDALRHGLALTCVAAVGPVVAEAIRAQGWRVDLVPESSFFMKPLASALAERLGPALT